MAKRDAMGGMAGNDCNCLRTVGSLPRRAATGALVLAAYLCDGGCASPPPSEETSVTPAVTRQELSAHVHYLAHPSLEGRKPKTKGGVKAVHYVTERFKTCGLQPWPGTTRLQMPFGLGANVVGILPGSDPELSRKSSS